MPSPEPTRGRAAAQRRIAERREAEAAARVVAQRRRRTVVGGVVSVAVVVIAVVAAFLVQTARTSTAADAATPSGTAAGTSQTAFAIGADDAPVTVDVYEDYQCPNCSAFEQAAGSTLEDLVTAGTVRVVQHGMAFLDTSANDDYSTRALNAAAVVASTSGSAALQAFHDLLFAHQPAEGGSGLTDDQLVGYAEQAGASGADVEDGIRDLVYGDWTATATDQASRDGVTGTPTVLVDGTVLDDLSADGLTAAVTAAQRE